MSLALMPEPEPNDFDEINRQARVAAIMALGRKSNEDPVWPWPSVGNALGPMLPGSLVILGGYTGNGKTAVLLNVARGLLAAKVPWAYVGLEMADHMLVSLLAALDCGLSRAAVIENSMSNAEADKVVASIQALYHSSGYMHFVPDPEMTADQVAARLRILHQQRGIRVAVIDHLHHLNYDDYPNLRQGVSRAVRLLKTVAVELGITLICSAQLRRESGDKAQAFRVPGLSELLETGTIEQVADMVLFTHRQIKPGSIDKLRAFQRGDPMITVADFAQPNRLALTIAKHRFGRTVGVTTALHLHYPSDRLTELQPHDAGDAWEGA